MKNKIFYFSGTGNSLKLAQDINQQLPQSELIKISSSFDFTQQQDTETIGFIFPIYCFGLPKIVRDFVKNLKISPNVYIYAVSSYGGLLCSAMDIIRQDLNDKGLQLQAGMAINLPGNFIPMYEIKDQKTQEKMNQKAKAQIMELLDTVQNRAQRKPEKNLGIIGKLLTHFIYKSFIGQMTVADKEFIVEPSCDGCTVCQRICPVNNIQIKEGKPVWQHSCEQCLACLHWCPQAAIQVGKKTINRQRYHHPEITLKEMLS